MSVRLSSKDGKIEEGISNGGWRAIVQHARAFACEKIPDWNGCHDGQEWTPEQLTIMADRLEQSASRIALLRELAAAGGVKIS